MEPTERRAAEQTMVVARIGRLVETGEPLCPYRLIDPDGLAVDAVSVFFAELLASGRRPATLRSYGMDLLRWFRFCWAAGVTWDTVTQREAREFSLLLEVAPKPVRPHWRSQDGAASSMPAAAGGQYSPAVRVHSETVLRSFYDFHAITGDGPAKNPFPLERSRHSSRANAHHNPMEPYRNASSGRYRPRVAARVPRAIPDTEFNELFARLGSNRDRALVCFYVSTGARASELLSARRSGVDPGRGVITVVRKGSGALQELPASPDAFVFLRLYELEMENLVPKGRRAPLFFTLRRPYRPLTYHAVHRMFERVNAEAGTDSTLHSLRHTAAYRMAEDPRLPLTDVQYVLGHVKLTTTQLYLTPRKEDVIRRVLAHHAEQTRRALTHKVPDIAPEYRLETLDVLFGRSVR
ncbi:MAG: tyrosine-type recombinase/integrase [Acidimicrobiales bacterium]